MNRLCRLIDSGMPHRIRPRGIGWEIEVDGWRQGSKKCAPHVPRFGDIRKGEDGKSFDIRVRLEL